MYWNLSRFCFSAPYPFCVEKNYDEKSEKKKTETKTQSFSQTG